MFKKEWIKGTSLYPEKNETGIRATVDYSLVELHPNPTLLNRAITKNLEILWCCSAMVDPIYTDEKHVLVIMKRDSSEEIAHIFNEEAIRFLKANMGKKHQLVVKTRIPLADPLIFFHEIRHIESSKKT